MITFEVNQRAGKAIPKAFWTGWLKKVVAAAGWRSTGSISIAIIDAKAMRQLNWQYRGINQPTDVLSFSEVVRLPVRPAPADLYLGEVILCPTEVHRRAKREGLGFDQALARLFVHGVLHLLNYHHQTKPATTKMERLEQKILDF